MHMGLLWFCVGGCFVSDHARKNLARISAIDAPDCVGALLALGLPDDHADLGESTRLKSDNRVDDDRAAGECDVPSAFR